MSTPKDHCRYILSPEERGKFEEGEKGLVGFVMVTYQQAIRTLTKENWTEGPSDTIGHWWRVIGQKLGMEGKIDNSVFLKEYTTDTSTLSFERAQEIAQATEKYLLELLEQMNKGGISPGRGSTLDAIYNPPLDELAYIIQMQDDEECNLP